MNRGTSLATTVTALVVNVLITLILISGTALEPTSNVRYADLVERVSAESWIR